MDPGFTIAKAFLSFALMTRNGHGWGNRESNLPGARMAREALESHDDDPDVLRLAGQTLASFNRDFDRALASTERALATDARRVRRTARGQDSSGASVLRFWLASQSPMRATACFSASRLAA